MKSLLNFFLNLLDPSKFESISWVNFAISSERLLLTAIFRWSRYVSYNNSSSVGESSIKLWTASSIVGCLVQHRTESSSVENNKSLLLISSTSVALS